MHHARLENILEELIVVNGPTRLDLKNLANAGGMSIGIEALQYLALASKKHWDNYLVLGGLTFLNPESERLQSWPEPSHNRVAVLLHSCGRINGVRILFEKGHDRKTKFWRR